MASGTTPFWILPMQILATMAPCINFGGSVLHSPLIMPMLQLPGIPILHTSRQNAYLLHSSEKFFPPLSFLSEFCNLALLLSSFLVRDADPQWADKSKLYAIALFFNLSTTFYALYIMVPHNRKIKALAKELELRESTKSADDEKMGEDEQVVQMYRELQGFWIRNNYGRASCMLSGAIVAMYALTS
ncbi:uncharacterized protein BCR38DRAFT_486059 [Pseudomassariella vexata]|uniref:DUF1772-domain-containing protein n=1 Tax=Pseudomassariella vexata TaxID=1141098 RepID=A0A1Y2DVJ2_9PEZI|nr:uncharacterized protein BCR38DRAFT_486059 [Pseudomassariella vexata]ORY63312.1 hypothetical protein BCR38DRAFT_486059 [Pseudomassariella vexata]